MRDGYISLVIEIKTKQGDATEVCWSDVNGLVEQRAYQLTKAPLQLCVCMCACVCVSVWDTRAKAVTSLAFHSLLQKK